MIWRVPPAETNDYPGLWLHDGRVSGSITVNRSRLPLWCFTGELSHGGWDSLVKSHRDLDGITPDEFYEFVHHVLDVRGEFGRLIMILADVERREQKRSDSGRDGAWWEHSPSRKRVIKQLRLCLEALG